MLHTTNETVRRSGVTMDGQMASCLLVLLILTAAVTPALAEPISRNVAILIEEPDDDAVKCGITASSLHDRVTFVMTAARWTIDPSATNGSIYINTNVLLLSDDQFCVYNIQVQILRVLILANGRHLPAMTVDKGMILSRQRHNAGSDALDQIESLVKAAIGEAEAKGL